MVYFFFDEAAKPVFLHPSEERWAHFYGAVGFDVYAWFDDAVLAVFKLQRAIGALRGDADFAETGIGEHVVENRFHFGDLATERLCHGFMVFSQVVEDGDAPCQFRQ